MHISTREQEVRSTALWLFLTLSCLYCGLSRGHFVVIDEVQVYQTTASIVEHGDLTIAPIRNTVPDAEGDIQTQYNLGLAVAAVPLYAVGRGLQVALEELGWTGVELLFAGPRIGAPPIEFGGHTEMFFVALTNAFTVAALCALFFHTAHVRLGARHRTAAACALLLGLTTLVGAHAISLFRHAPAALFLLAGINLLLADVDRPAVRTRAAAGCALGLMMHFRLASVIAWPAVVGYAAWHAHRRCREPSRAGRHSELGRELAPLALPLAANIAIHFGVTYARLGRWFSGYEGQLTWDQPWSTSLYGYLFSPGQSLFLFAPVLILAPWALKELWYPRRDLALTLITIAATYLLFYGKTRSWHGAWCLGPRMLVPIIPALMLPIAPWLDRRRWRWRAVVPLAVVGFAIQAVQVMVNWAFVWHREGFELFQPRFGYLFIPASSPLAAHVSALFEAGTPVDMWLVHVYRTGGIWTLAAVLVLWLGTVAACAWQLWRGLPSNESPRR